MSYASLLVHVQDDHESDKRVRLASLLASRFNANLIGVAGAMLDTLVMEPSSRTYISKAIVNEEMERAEHHLETLEQRFRNTATTGKDRLQWEGSIQFPADIVFHKSSVADLIIIGRHDNSNPNLLYSSLDPADVLMRCGRPVLLVPPEISSLSADHIVVGWSNTREARRAVMDALPLLRLASRVSVVEVVDHGGVAAAQKRVGDVAEFLLLHDVEAIPHVLEQGVLDTAERLALYAEHEHADLIVSGGYGHARSREWLFGGVTQSMLQRCPKCCLISH